ncbi:hypothetical protein Q8O96_30695 [Pseudomonas sp. LPH60]|uniref:KfrB domain-containing protein n=1 Tax=Pseudomonas sp. LPH60 TaxID=3065906 RepID=UPI00273BB065|nr:hypothetical protein [Pseudomonas sp. LPH60]MDP4573441.1 hypothetical protein [Pseudomonas sp. LPH60]
MSQEQAIAPSPSSSAQAKTQSIRGYRMDSGNIPQEIRTNVAAVLSPEADVFPAKENGSYKGPVIHADSNYIVQAVGKSNQTAVIHQRGDVEMMGASLKGRDANNDLVGRNLQVHYRGDQAKVYPWDAQKEAVQRADRTTEHRVVPERNSSAVIAGQVLNEAEKYATENIKNAKQREAFLKHLSNVTQQFQPQPLLKAQEPPSRSSSRNEVSKAAHQPPRQQAAQDIER